MANIAVVVLGVICVALAFEVLHLRREMKEKKRMLDHMSDVIESKEMENASLIKARQLMWHQYKKLKRGTPMSQEEERVSDAEIEAQYKEYMTVDADGDGADRKDR